ncbi:hypothetical protein GCM10025790_10420 [Nesterenkonia rhizosphaerae]|uniref:Uncharacterized protein n=1 Tax=Nesterenkonia rhizosphaerae TaxID=1348272 RepID=A0ABP9FTN1_9MICC
MGGDGHLLAALTSEAYIHRPQDVEEFCPATFGDPCPVADRFQHRDVGDGAFVHAGSSSAASAWPARMRTISRLSTPCEEYRAVLEALGPSQR